MRRSAHTLKSKDCTKSLTACDTILDVYEHNRSQYNSILYRVVTYDTSVWTTYVRNSYIADFVFTVTGKSVHLLALSISLKSYSLKF